VPEAVAGVKDGVLTVVVNVSAFIEDMNHEIKEIVLKIVDAKGVTTTKV
jgi:hypothetical protein